jgi:FOG: EAL domain
MIDGQNLQLAFLLFEAVLCFILTPLYAVSRDPLRVRKSVVLSLNIICGFMLLCEYLFYVYKGTTGAMNVLIMLAKDIDIDTVAEGVEQNNQINVLKGLGVDVIQG